MARRRKSHRSSGRGRSSGRSGRASSGGGGSGHMPMLLLAGAAVGGYLLYQQNQKTKVPLAQTQIAMAPAQNMSTQAITNAIAAMSQTSPVINDGSSDPTTAQAFSQAALPDGTNVSGLEGLAGFGNFAGIQPSGALPGMGAYHRNMRALTTGGPHRGVLAGNGVGSFWSSLTNFFKAPIKNVEAITLSSRPLALATGGTSLLSGKLLQKAANVTALTGGQNLIYTRVLPAAYRAAVVANNQANSVHAIQVAGLGGFRITHVFNHQAHRPQQLSGLGSFFHSVAAAVTNTAKAVVAAPAKVVSAIAAPIEAITGAGGLKVPLAIATMGVSLEVNAAAKVADKVTSAVSNVVLKPLNKIGGSQTAQPTTATTDCNGYGPGQVVYQDGTGASITCNQFMTALNILQSQSSVALSVNPIGTSPAVFTLPSSLPVAQITATPTSSTQPVTINPATGLPYAAPGATSSPYGSGYNSVPSTTQVNPATGIPYPAGTPINPSTGAAYINPASGTAWPAGTTIDQATGQPVGAINPATGTYYPAIYATTSAGISYTAPIINPATGLPYTPLTSSTINPATGLPYTSATINPMTGLPYPTVASPSDPTSVASTTQINPATGVAYPVGTPINPMTGQAYINPLTGVAWPPYTVIDQYTGYPISAINPATGTYYPINPALISSAGSSSVLTAQQQAAYGQYGPGGITDPGYGTDYTQDPGMAPNPAMSAPGGIDPATGIPYSQEQAPAAAAPAPAAAPVPAPSKVSWWMVGGAAVAVPAFMYFAHK